MYLFYTSHTPPPLPTEETVAAFGCPVPVHSGGIGRGSWSSHEVPLHRSKQALRCSQHPGTLL